MAFPGGTIGAAAAAYAGYRLYSSLGNSSKRHDSRGRVVLVRLSLIAPFLTHYNYSPMRISLIRISLIRISLSRTHLSGVTSQSRRRQRNAASELRLLFLYLKNHLSSEVCVFTGIVLITFLSSPRCCCSSLDHWRRTGHRKANGDTIWAARRNPSALGS